MNKKPASAGFYVYDILISAQIPVAVRLAGESDLEDAAAGKPNCYTDVAYLRALRITNFGVAATCSTPRNSRDSLE